MLLRTSASAEWQSLQPYVLCYIELCMKNNNAKVQVGLGMKFAFSSVVVDNT